MNMDATQFQAAALAYGSAATITIGVLVGVVIALIKGFGSIRDALHQTDTAVAAVTATTAIHERQLNGDLTPRIEAIADQRIAAHRRPGDTTGPVIAPPRPGRSTDTAPSAPVVWPSPSGPTA